MGPIDAGVSPSNDLAVAVKTADAEMRASVRSSKNAIPLKFWMDHVG